METAPTPARAAQGVPAWADRWDVDGWTGAGRLAVGIGIVLVGSAVRMPESLLPAVLGVAALTANRFRPWARRVWVAAGLLVAMLVCGVILNAQTSFIGWVLIGVAMLRLLGDPEFPLAVGAPLAVGGGALAVWAGWADDLTGTVALWNVVVVAGIVAASYGRRSGELRRASERALVERSRELEQRSLELIAQTERTQAETARAAALEERGRIARDLHDLLAHALGGLVVQLDAAEAQLAAGAPREEVGARLRASRDLAVGGLRDARAAVRELRDRDPGATGDVAEAVGAIVGGPVGLHLGVRFDVVGEPRPAPAEVADAFAAVAREALTNVNKHAAGARVSATLAFEPEAIRLEVLNAVAGSPGALAETGAGFGLDAMRARLADVGGAVTAGPAGTGRWLVAARWPAGDEEGDAVRPDAGEGR